MPRAVLAVLVVLVALVAGCTAPSVSPSPEADAPPGTLASALFESDSCEEGGGYVVWNPDGLNDERAGYLAPPFEFADVSEDLGHPPVTAFGEVSRTPLAGAYHAVVSCPTWTFQGEPRTDLLMAFVTMRVLPPPFDPAPVERQYIAGVLAVNDADLDVAFRAAGIHMENLLSASLSFEHGLLRSTMQFDHHGDIISVVPVETESERIAETIHLWFLSPLEDGGARPVALDFVDVGGTRLNAHSPGHFDHRAASPAPPAPGVVPLHEFSSWALGYRDVARTVRPGPVVDVVLDVDAGHRS
jgi:hypothetical protein